MCSGRDCGLAGVRAPQVHLVICYSGSDVARLLWRIKSGHSSQARLGCVLSHSAARRCGGVCACSRAARLLVRELVRRHLCRGVCACSRAARLLVRELVRRHLCRGVCACSRAARLLVRELVATPPVQGRVRVLTSSAAPGWGARCDAGAIQALLRRTALLLRVGRQHQVPRRLVSGGPRRWAASQVRTHPLDLLAADPGDPQEASTG